MKNNFLSKNDKKKGRFYQLYRHYLRLGSQQIDGRIASATMIIKCFSKEIIKIVKLAGLFSTMLDELTKS